MPATRLRRRIGWVANTALLLATAATAEAQRGTAELVGIVTDSAGAPVAGADVAIVTRRFLVQTDDAGRFRMGRLHPGRVAVMVRRIGFEPQEIEVALHEGRTDSLVIRLTPNVHLLEGVAVEADVRRRMFVEEFHRRRVRGMGYYVTREEIAAQNAYRTSDVLRTAPGLRFVQSPGGMGVRFASSPSIRRDCIPMIWLDGQRVPGMEVDEIPVTDVEGIELYSGPATTPLEFSQTMSLPSCGTIVIWTRVPGT